MGGATNNIRKKYGGNSRQSMNRAIRAEFTDGQMMLDRMHKLHGNHRWLTKHCTDDCLPENPDNVVSEFAVLRKKKDEMVLALRKKYE